MNITFTQVVELTGAALIEFLQKHVKTFGKIATAMTAFSGEVKTASKYTAALQGRYQAAKDKSEIGKHVSFSDYFAANVGGKCPGRTMALASLINTLVLVNDEKGQPLLSWEAFDKAPDSWLEKANVCLGLIVTRDGAQYRTSAETLDVIAALGREPGDKRAMAELAEIQKALKPAKAGEEIIATGKLDTNLCFGYLSEAIKTVTDEEAMKGLFLSCHKLMGLWDAKAEHADKMDAWFAERENAAPVITGEIGASGVAPVFIDVQPLELAA